MNLASKACVPCQVSAAPIMGETLQTMLREVSGWEAVDEHHLSRAYRFRNFVAALEFTNRVGSLAEAERHHPEIHLAWGRVRVDVWTHKIDGLTESDFIFAAKLDQIESRNTSASVMSGRQRAREGGQMGTNQAIRDAQSGKQPVSVAEPGDQQRSLVAAAKSTDVAEGDVFKVLERIGASCHIEQVLSNGPAERSVIVRLDSRNEVAWHRHTQSTNIYFCLEGTMVVETRGPDSRSELTSGQTFVVQPKLFHRVVGNGDCRFVVVYRDGAFDVRLGD